MTVQPWEKPLRSEYRKNVDIFNNALQVVEKVCQRTALENLFPKNTPRLISRMKSEDGVVEIVKRKFKNNDIFKKWIGAKNFTAILFDDSGIGDLIGMGLIFTHVDDYDTIVDKFVSNFLVGKNKCQIIKGRDIKNRESGYKAIHSHVFVPIEHKGKSYKVHSKFR